MYRCCTWSNSASQSTNLLTQIGAELTKDVMFIIIDYIFYRLRLGRHSVEAKRNRHPINLSWEGEYEPVLEKILTEGDLLFFAKNNSFISWLVQYFTKADISHAGVYMGEGKVIHATLSGSRIDLLSAFFEEGCHVIPVVMRPVIKSKNPRESDLRKFVGKPYPIGPVICRGGLYLIGMPWRKFRFTYLFDVITVSAIFLFLFFGEDFYFPLMAVAIVYLALVVFSFLVRNKIIFPISDPGEGFDYLPGEAIVVHNIKKMNEDWFKEKLSRNMRREN